MPGVPLLEFINGTFIGFETLLKILLNYSVPIISKVSLNVKNLPGSNWLKLRTFMLSIIYGENSPRTQGDRSEDSEGHNKCSRNQCRPQLSRLLHSPCSHHEWSNHFR